MIESTLSSNHTLALRYAESRVLGTLERCAGVTWAALLNAPSFPQRLCSEIESEA